MKNKDIQKIIKRDLSSSIPDVLPNIDLEAIEINVPERRYFNKRFTVPRLAFVSVLSIVLVLVILLTRGGSIIDPPIGEPNIVFNEKEEIYAISAVSAVSLLHQTIESPSNQVYSGFGQTFLSTNIIANHSRLIDSHIETLNRYLNAIEPILNNREQLGFTVETSDLEGYDYKLVFKSFDLRNQPIEKVIYYNESISDNQVTLEGLMIVDGKTYVMHAEINIEDDEFELELTAYQMGNEDDSIYVYQEIKANRQTFEYEIIRFGDTLFESTLEIINKEDYIIIELEYESITEEVTFEIKRVQYDTFDVLYIEYEIDSEFYDEEGFIVVEVFFNANTEEYIYRYTITIEDETYTYDRDRMSIIDAKFYIENQLDFVHFYTLEIIDFFEGSFTQLFDKTESLENDYNYERRLPIFYNNQINFLVLKYNLVEDEDIYEVIGKLEFNGTIYEAEGTLELEGSYYELEVVFYDLEDDTNYLELNEIYEDDYTLFYALVLDDEEVFTIEVFIEDNTVSLEFNNELTFTQEVIFINTGSILFSGVYEIESDTIDEEGIIQILNVYDDLAESYYYQYAITVRNIRQSYDITNE